MNVNVKEVLRYLGYRGNGAEQNIIDLVEGSWKEVLEASTMRSIYSILSVEFFEENKIGIGSTVIKSKNLTKNLKGCEKIVLFAATLGTRVDVVLSKFSKTNMSKAVVMHACAAAIIEEYCDECQKEISEAVKENGLYVRPRFSPGYGDFNIMHQKDITNMLETSKKIGLSLTESLMLVPTKSVTAIMGLSTSKENCNIKGCEVCDKKDCLFRRD